MSGATADPARRAQRLMRFYPQGWRARYGDEFAELLVSELSDRPRTWRLTANLAWGGSQARLTQAGFRGQALGPSEQIRASLVSLGCAMATFLAFGVAMWSQLTIGWQWSRPDALGTTMAVIIMSSLMLLFVCLGFLAAVPIVWSVVGRLVRRQAGGLIRPSLLFCTGASLLIVGARHFGNGWPGTGGHPWFGQGLVPGGVAAFTWASTLSVTSYWAHPGALRSFPTAEVAWMAISPVSMVCLVVGAAKTVIRLDLSPKVLRYEVSVGVVATVGMLFFLVGSGLWLIDGGSGPRNLFHAGAIDLAGIIVMTAALVVAHRSVVRAGLARPACRPR